jgi:ubiquinone/menaquinone biosynthesis C-methylase UbiE
MQPDEEVIRRWNDSAPYWEKYGEVIERMFAPITEALVEDAEIARQQTVLDVATGAGQPALSVAALVGPEGKVFGIDPIPAMVAGARRAAERLGLKNAEFEIAFADRLPFPADSFDAVISRFGVMFFPSPADGVHEMLRVLKPGRKLALAVWHFAERNPFHWTMSRVIDRYVESPPLAPDAPDVFRFASPGKLAQVMTEAGATDVSERLLQFAIQAAMPVEDYWNMRSEWSEKFREKIGLLSPEQAKEAKREILEAFREYSTDGGMSFPAEVLIVSGSKGGPA